MTKTDTCVNKYFIKYNVVSTFNDVDIVLYFLNYFVVSTTLFVARSIYLPLLEDVFQGKNTLDSLFFRFVSSHYNARLEKLSKLRGRCFENQFIKYKLVSVYVFFVEKKN